MTAVASHTLALPYPPSINSYWRRRGQRYFINGKGIVFREAVQAEVESLKLGKLIGPVAFSAILHPLDRKIRDLDNTLKPIWDALQHAGVIQNDCQIRKLAAEFRDIRAGGECVVHLAVME